MGTRADFYVKKEKQMEWIASIAWDGNPGSIDKKVLKSKSEETFRNNLREFLEDRNDVSYPKNGWPWPWNDSRTTDYAYIFENNKVMASNFGSPLFNPLIKKPDDDLGDEPTLQNYFPDMSKIQNIAWDNRSGLIII